VKNTGKLNDEVDELFKLPLAEFTEARNALAKRLKLNGRADDANLVKTLVKPPVSAWAVNQLYWHHRDAFEQLLAAGQRFHKAQASNAAGKLADLRGSLNARREALTELSQLAESLLTEGGHSPSPDTIRRITTTLEALSAYASVADGPNLGRLSQDVDPPGFELLASFVSDGRAAKATAAPAKGSPKSASAAAAPPQKANREARQLEEKRQRDERRQERQVRIAAAKLSLQAAKRALVDARARAQSFDGAQKKANAEVKEAEKRKREAEDRLKHASAAAEEAARRARSVADDAAAASAAVEDARRNVEKESKELESLFSELP
jgi:hypothetical protein